MTLTTRIAAARRFLRIAEGHLPEPVLAPARPVVERAAERHALSDKHTVIALAGATGSGKSSIFNAIAGSHLSDTGLRRPTTSVPHACVWSPDGAAELLDWLGIPANRRFDRECEPDDLPANRFRGLILIDLPDFDSVEAEHRAEVDRMLSLVDRVVWILDPQKYGDDLVHERYLRPSARHRDTTAVVLNQADTLAPAEVVQCLADLRRLLDEGGLAGVPVLASSTVAPHGLNQLRTLLERGVAADDGPLARISVDLDTEIDRLRQHVAAEATEDRADRVTVGHLIDALSVVAGVPSRLDTVEERYLRRARLATGWPVLRWMRRLRRDPLRRLQLPDGELADAALPEVTAAQRAAAALATRELVEELTAGLPDPWPEAARTAARAREKELTQALEAAVAGVDPGALVRPRWWGPIRIVHWFAVRLMVAALGTTAGCLAADLISPGSLPDLVGDNPSRLALRVSGVIFVVGLALGAGLAAGAQPLIQFAARQARRRAELRLRVAVAEVASDLVVAPARGVLRAYTDARAALHPAD